MFSKRLIVITLSAVVAVSAVIGAAFLILRSGKQEVAVSKNEAPSASSTVSQLVSQVNSKPEEPKKEPKEVYLSISSPSYKNVTTNEKEFTFSGISDPKKPLTVNGENIKREKNGIFSYTVTLKEGKNTFEFNHKGKTQLYTVNYRFVLIKGYNPSGNESYKSGSTVTVSVIARNGSNVTAQLGSNKITLTRHNAQSEEKPDSQTFVTYIGSFKLPVNNTSASKSLGKIKYCATYKGRSEAFYSGKITVKKPEIKVTYSSNAAPLGGKYINVGEGKITEIIDYEAETFDARSTNDWSRPTNNYLPKGTVDYSAQGYYYYEGSTRKEYALLRCGRQVYTSKTDSITKKKIAVVKEYKGTLPDHNEIKIASFQNNGSYTVLTLDTLWKAPFYFDIRPQSYSNPKKQDYKISSVTSEYVDITLCYTTVFKGSINVPKTNPIFRSAKIIKNKSDYTIRLYLRERGGFYGWVANYNAKGQLVFEFLNPARVESAGNYYGANLKGVKVLVDVGHGGKDPGALGFDSKNHNEAIQNLALANKIASELRKIGATVILTRTGNSTVSNHDKIKMLRDLKPDICIAVHHNSNYSQSANGFDAYYSHPFSYKAAALVYKYTKNTGIYKSNGLGWHYYFMARSSYCPVVLTENGFISNYYDYKNIINSSVNTKKARAIVKGIAEYFLSISPDDVPLEGENSSAASSSKTSSTVKPSDSPKPITPPIDGEEDNTSATPSKPQEPPMEEEEEENPSKESSSIENEASVPLESSEPQISEPQESSLPASSTDT